MAIMLQFACNSGVVLLCYFEECMWGFSDLLKVRPSSMFMVRQSLLCIFSLMIWSMYQDLAERILVPWTWA